jgi:hypothetical protein
MTLLNDPVCNVISTIIRCYQLEPEQERRKEMERLMRSVGSAMEAISERGRDIEERGQQV